MMRRQRHVGDRAREPLEVELSVPGGGEGAGQPVGGAFVAGAWLWLEWLE